MKRNAPIIAALALTLAATAHAQLNRTFVSTTGSDTNPCTPALPCRSFDAALAQTNSGGEVVALDSGGYGPFTVSNEVVILGAPGVHAALTATSGTAVTINAGLLETVVLRGLSLSGRGAEIGVDAITAGSVHLETCDVAGFTSVGVRFRHSGDAFVTDSMIRENYPNVGLLFESDLGQIKGTVDQTRILKNNIGCRVWGDAKVAVTNSVAAGNFPSIAFQVLAKEGMTSELTLESSLITNNWSGAIAFVAVGVTGQAIIRLSNTTIVGQGNTGINHVGTGAQILSFGNNQIHGNGFEGAPSGMLPQQ